MNFFNQRLGKRISTQFLTNEVEIVGEKTYIVFTYNSDFERGSGIKKFSFLKNDEEYTLAGYQNDAKNFPNSEGFANEKSIELLKNKVKEIQSMMKEVAPVLRTVIFESLGGISVVKPRWFAAVG